MNKRETTREEKLNGAMKPEEGTFLLLEQLYNGTVSVGTRKMKSVTEVILLPL